MGNSKAWWKNPLNVFNFGCHLLKNNQIVNKYNDPILFSTSRKHCWSYSQECCNEPPAIFVEYRTQLQYFVLSVSFLIFCIMQSYRELDPVDMVDSEQQVKKYAVFRNMWVVLSWWRNQSSSLRRSSARFRWISCFSETSQNITVEITMDCKIRTDQFVSIFICLSVADLFWTLVIFRWMTAYLETRFSLKNCCPI